jgi:hypothetical protein
LGFEYIGLTTLYVPSDQVTVPDVEYDTLVKGTRDYHEVITTDSPTLLLARKRACFCASCLDSKYEDCTNEDASPVEEHRLKRPSSAHITSARAKTKTRATQDEHRRALALLATEDSVIGIRLPTQEQLAFVQVTASMSLVVGTVTCPVTKVCFPEGDFILQGKWLLREANTLRATGAKDIIFCSSDVRTAPLPFDTLEDGTLEIREEMDLLAQEYLT